MKRSILTITTIIALAIPAAVSAATITDSFERDLNRNNAQVSTEARTGQDSVQQYVNRSINGSDALFASFDRDLYRVSTPAASATRNTDSVQQLINVALTGSSNTLIASFNRDLYRASTPAAPATRNTDSVQQLINVALTEKSNTFIASFERGIGIEIATVINYQNTFQLNPELITAFA